MLKKYEPPHVPNKALSTLDCSPCSSSKIVESSDNFVLDNIEFNSRFTSRTPCRREATVGGKNPQSFEVNYLL